MPHAHAHGDPDTQRRYDAAQRRQRRTIDALVSTARNALAHARACDYTTTAAEALERVNPTGASTSFARKLAARIRAHTTLPRAPTHEFHPRNSTPGNIETAITAVASECGIPAAVIAHATRAAQGMADYAPPAHPRPLQNERLLNLLPPSPTSIALAMASRYGFNIGYTGPALRIWRDNHPSFYGPLAPEADKLMQEHVDNGWAIRVTPLYTANPMLHCISHPQAIIPKSRPNAYRQLFDGSAGAYANVNDFCDLRSLATPKCATTSDVRNMIAACAATHPNEPLLLYTADLTNAYKSLPVLPSQWHLLAIPWKGDIYWQTVDPFGLRASAAHLYSATLPVIQSLKESGVDACLYVDDSFTVATAANMHGPNGNRARLRQGFSDAGFAIQELKEVPPATSVKYIGWVFDTIANTQTLPHAKLRALRDSIAHLSTSRRIQRAKLETLLGHLHHAASGSRHLASFTAELQHLLSCARGNNWVVLSAEARLDLRLWHSFIEHFNGTLLISPPAPTATIYTDASTTWGWGWHCPTLQLYGAGEWPPEMRPDIDAGTTHINQLELMGAITAITACTPHAPPGTIFNIHCDNTTAISCVTKGRGKSGPLARITRTFAYIRETTHAAHTPPHRALHIKGSLNTVADSLSRGHTPGEVTEHLRIPTCPTWTTWLASCEAPWEALLPSPATKQHGATSSVSAPPLERQPPFPPPKTTQFSS